MNMVQVVEHLTGKGVSREEALEVINRMSVLNLSLLLVFSTVLQ